MQNKIRILTEWRRPDGETMRVIIQGNAAKVHNKIGEMQRQYPKQYLRKRKLQNNE